MESEATFKSLDKEQLEPVEGRITGKIPSWLSGNFYRNGPGKYEVGDTKYDHLFDGLALLHKYSVRDGKVTYQNRLLESDSYKKNMKAGRIVVSSFGTVAHPDPCKTLFQRFFSYFTLYEDEMMTDNCNVNVFPVGDQLFVCTETKWLRKLDPETLKTPGKVDLTKIVASNSATAHPHHDRDGSVYNIGSCFKGRPYMTVIRWKPDPSGKTSQIENAELVASLPNPYHVSYTYSHSFGLTENFLVVIAQPLFINVLYILTAKIRGVPFTNAMHWDKNTKTVFHIVNKKTGEIVNPDHSYVGDALLVFHHINAYEDNDHIVLDICSTDDGTVLTKVTRENMLKKQVNDITAKVRAKRFVLPLKLGQNQVGENLVMLPNTKSTATLQSDKTIYCKDELLSDIPSEFPNVNYDRVNGLKYQYMYGVTFDANLLFGAGIIKLDVQGKTSVQFTEEGCYFTEPWFVPSPNSAAEDDGVVLSAVQNNQMKTFLLVLDAKTFTELGRAEFDVAPPMGFHGRFLDSDLIRGLKKE